MGARLQRVVKAGRKPQPAYIEGWNDALNAAAVFLSRDYIFVRRPLDPKTMMQPIEIYPGDAKIKGDYIEACHCNPDDDGKDVAAILSLKRKSA